MKCDEQERTRLQSIADRALADARNTAPDSIAIAVLQNAYGYLIGAHDDKEGVQRHIEKALDAAGESYQVADVV